MLHAPLGTCAQGQLALKRVESPIACPVLGVDTPRSLERRPTEHDAIAFQKRRAQPKTVIGLPVPIRKDSIKRKSLLEAAVPHRIESPAPALASSSAEPDRRAIEPPSGPVRRLGLYSEARATPRRRGQQDQSADHQTSPDGLPRMPHHESYSIAPARYLDMTTVSGAASSLFFKRMTIVDVPVDSTTRIEELTGGAEIKFLSDGAKRRRPACWDRRLALSSCFDFLTGIASIA